jgi:hypothetical protein
MNCPGLHSIVDEWKLRGRPEQLATDWDPVPWIEQFPGYKEFLLDLKSYDLGFLHRNLIKEIVILANNEDEYLNGLLAVMIWGYSGNSVGPARARRIFDESGVAENLEKAWNLIMEAKYGESTLQDLKLGEAFDVVVKDIKYLGPSFGSKYLYFAASDLEGNEMSLTPVILDKRIVTAWKYWFDEEIELGSIDEFGYVEFLKKMSTVAKQLGIKPEELEFVLFCNTGEVGSNSNWASLQVFNEINEFETIVWALAFAGELMLQNSRLFPVWTQPGGGQYNCLSIYHEENSEIHLDLNLDGRIHAFFPQHSVTDWGSLVHRGAYQAAKYFSKLLPSSSETLAVSSPWAVAMRSLASMLINDSQLKDAKLTPFFTDNSTYGQSTSIDLITKYQHLLPSDKRSAPLGLPSEVWLYELETSFGRTGLVDLFDGSIIWDGARKEELYWPRLNLASGIDANRQFS